MTEGQQTDGVPRPSRGPSAGTAERRKRGSRGRRRPPRPTSGRDRIGYSQRHQGRVLALQILYEVDLTEHDPVSALERTLAEEEALSQLSEEDEPVPAAAVGHHQVRALREHVERLVKGTLAARAEIDPRVEAAAPAFPMERVAAIDRNVLRLAVYELLHEPDVPPKVVINEAVELAKRFGGESSGRFVNGVLGTIVEQVVPATAVDRATGERSDA